MHDAFGKRRNATAWSGALPGSNWTSIAALTHRGFTSHEQLDNVGLIHMNGRVYDPNIARFISADPVVQAPLLSQSLNRYSYVMNNPLSLTDPSGFSWFSKHWKKVTRFFKKHWREIVAAVVAVVVTVATVGTMTGFWGAVAQGAVAGGIYGATVTGLHGGNLAQIMRGGLTGAIAGGIAAGIGYGMGQLFAGQSARGARAPVDFGVSLGDGAGDVATTNAITSGVNPAIVRGVTAAADQPIGVDSSGRKYYSTNRDRPVYNPNPQNELFELMEDGEGYIWAHRDVVAQAKAFGGSRAVELSNAKSMCVARCMAEDMLLDQAQEVAVEQGAGTLEQYGDYTMRRNYGDRHLYGGGAVAKGAGKTVLKALPVYKAIDLLHDIFFTQAECAAMCVDAGQSNAPKTGW